MFGVDNEVVCVNRLDTCVLLDVCEELTEDVDGDLTNVELLKLLASLFEIFGRADAAAATDAVDEVVVDEELVLPMMQSYASSSFGFVGMSLIMFLTRIRIFGSSKSSSLCSISNAAVLFDISTPGKDFSWSRSTRENEKFMLLSLTGV